MKNKKISLKYYNSEKQDSLMQQNYNFSGSNCRKIEKRHQLQEFDALTTETGSSAFFFAAEDINKAALGTLPSNLPKKGIKEI